ncbi:homoserine O-acetyltransferase [Xanthomonas campestris]|nr:homoserine O-acetyltransferase [Xanthomonas sp. 3075]
MQTVSHAIGGAEQHSETPWTTRRIILAKNFILECGGVLPELEVCYTTAGKLSSTGDNVVWVFHALTADSNPQDWWNSLVGPGQVLSPERHFIVCANIIGSCYGTTGPSHAKGARTEGVGLNFPLVTMRDTVRAHKLLRKHLELGTISLGIGGSMGGQQAIEWACSEPDAFQRLVLIATSARHSPWGIACNEAQRMAMCAEEGFSIGDPSAGAQGLEAARAIAMLTYRGYTAFSKTQVDKESKVTGFAASSYMQHQGKKLSARFCPYSYWSLTKTMDSHDVSRGRGSIEDALSRVTSKVLVIAISSDVLFPPSDQHTLAAGIPDSKFAEIDSVYGHDGFLVEGNKITVLLEEFMSEIVGDSRLSVQSSAGASCGPSVPAKGT